MPECCRHGGILVGTLCCSGLHPPPCKHWRMRHKRTCSSLVARCACNTTWPCVDSTSWRTLNYSAAPPSSQAQQPSCVMGVLTDVALGLHLVTVLPGGCQMQHLRSNPTGADQCITEGQLQALMPFHATRSAVICAWQSLHRALYVTARQRNLGQRGRILYSAEGLACRRVVWSCQ